VLVEGVSSAGKFLNLQERFVQALIEVVGQIERGNFSAQRRHQAVQATCPSRLDMHLIGKLANGRLNQESTFL